MSAPLEILALVARFEQQLDSYQSGRYNETQLRREFLDPFFKALGWDVDNQAGYAQWQAVDSRLRFPNNVN